MDSLYDSVSLNKSDNETAESDSIAFLSSNLNVESMYFGAELKSLRINNVQKRSPEGVLEKMCSWKFRKIHRKIHSGLKETLAQVFSCEFCKIFKNSFFYRRPLVAASEC